MEVGGDADGVAKRWIYRPAPGILEPPRLTGRGLHKETALRLAIATLAALVALFSPGPAPGDPLLTYPLRINGHRIRAEVANTDASRRQGLMFRERLEENAGMIFVYPSQGPHAMWMKNTLVPLSVAFIDKHGRIINIEEMQPQTEDAHAAKGEAAYALEMNQGWFRKRGIKSGDRILGLERIPRSED